MALTFCLSATIIRKAGANANSTITASNTAIEEWGNQAEAIIQTATRVDFLSTYASLTAQTKKILEDVTSSLAAIQVINYDMSGFTSLEEAQTMLDVHRDTVDRGIALLRKKEATDFITDDG